MFNAPLIPPSASTDWARSDCCNDIKLQSAPFSESVIAAERPARPAGERRPVDVQKGQSSHTVRPSDPQEKRAEAPVREAAPREERPAAPAEAEAERRTHRPRPQADVPVKEHHRKPPVDDDDDEFEFGFLNWDDDDK